MADTAATQACGRCGRATHIEELGHTEGSIWLHCRLCGHLWREPGPGLDAFALILASRAAAATPVEEHPRPHAVPRAARFTVRLHARYRTASDREWRTGLTENISRSGVLIRTEQPIEPSQGVEIILELPPSVAGEPVSRVRCEGKVVRLDPEAAADPEGIAAAVTEYRFTPS